MLLCLGEFAGALVELFLEVAVRLRCRATLALRRP
jgi:hypothetical protein